MKLSHAELSNLGTWLGNDGANQGKTYPYLTCICDICNFAQTLGFDATIPKTSIEMSVFIQQALKLQERFNNCDVELLKQLNDI